MKLIKYTFLSLLSLVLVLVNPTFAVFSDVPSSHPNFDAIEYVQTENIVKGYADGSFGPNLSINRAEFLKIIIEAKFPGEIASYVVTADCFPDVPRDAWFAKYICFAKEKGIIGGYPDGTFRPTNTISLVEASKIIVIAFEIPYESTDTFGDSLEVWFEGYMLALTDRNLIPISLELFWQNLSRGEMAEIIYRMKGEVTVKDAARYAELLFASYYEEQLQPYKKKVSMQESQAQIITERNFKAEEGKLYRFTIDDAQEIREGCDMIKLPWELPSFEDTDRYTEEGQLKGILLTLEECVTIDTDFGLQIIVAPQTFVTSFRNDLDKWYWKKASYSPGWPNPFLFLQILLDVPEERLPEVLTEEGMSESEFGEILESIQKELQVLNDPLEIEFEFSVHPDSDFFHPKTIASLQLANADISNKPYLVAYSVYDDEAYYRFLDEAGHCTHIDGVLEKEDCIDHSFGDPMGATRNVEMTNYGEIRPKFSLYPIDDNNIGNRFYYYTIKCLARGLPVLYTKYFTVLHQKSCVTGVPEEFMENFIGDLE